MQWLASLCIRQPVLTWVLMLATVVIGGVGYGSLGVDQFPKIDIPLVLVTTTLQGAAPEVVETGITDKIEAAVNTISGIDELRSTSSDGVSLVAIAFSLDKDIDVAAQEVRDHLSTALPELPRGVDQPVVTKVDPDAAPILLVTMRGPGSVRDATEIADKRVRRLIESINGVGQVSILGGQKRQVNLWLDPLKLASMGLTALDVQRALATQNLTVPGGNIETGPRRISLRVDGRVLSIAEIGQIVLRENGGYPTRVADVATVEDGSEELASYASEDGHSAVVLSIRKQSGQNTVAVVDAIRERLLTLEQGLPQGYKLQVVRDNSGVIRTSLDAVKEHLVVGAILAALIVLLFLGDVRSTFIAALAIPISIIGTFALMWMVGFTLNMITLLALALAVGIVIDDAIVVLENITRYVREKRQKPFVAAVLATRDIGLAVLATTLSLLAVFLPVAFMGGIIGRFFQSFGLTMAFAIGVSMIVSFSLTPMLAARLLSLPPEGDEGKRTRLERFVDAFYLPIERGYVAMLRWIMAHRWVIVVASVATLASCFPMANAVPKGFQPEDDLAEFEVSIRAPEGSSLLETRLIGERIATEIRELPTVEHTLLTIGGDAQKSRNLANIYVRLVDPRQRAQNQTQVMDQVRREIVSRQRKDLRIQVSLSALISTGESTAAVQYAIYGPDLAKLERYTQQILERFRKVPGAVDVDSNLIVGNPELRVVVDRERAADLGVDIATVANTLQLMVAGLKISTYQEAGEEYEIRARAALDYRTDASALAIMTVPSASGAAVPLASLVSLQETRGPSQINRLSRQRQVTITANTAPGVGQSTVSDALKGIIDDLNMPPDYRAVPAGMTREQSKLAMVFAIAIGLTAVFMYLVLAAQFASWLHPITIMLALPLTIPFAFMSLLLFEQELSVMSALGIIVLFGVVKKNAILQVDHTNHLRAEGRPRLDAILEANRDRLRPILMTTLAFIAGMVPLIFSRGIGAGMNRSIAGVVVGGQALSLLLTLLATPVAYSFFDDIVEWRKRRSSRRAVDRGEAELARLESGPTGMDAPASAE
jgi:hydrophobic/amphiphilic exporter-1 (mainly G- bacteria), HAE1 family